MASARSGMALGPIQRLFDEGTLTGLTDAQLVERFLDRRDEGAFVALVARHGAMVLAVCRGVLKDPSDAEDAFQATFLVLFRKAGGLKSAGSLGGWLYRVAYRIAIRANAMSKRRRERPIEEVTMAAEARSPGEGEIDRELLPIIHAEIDRLPDRYQAPIALCCLQGLSYEQAAHQLGLPLGTVGSRITRARELLRSRLVRRGVTATTAALSVLLAREATAAPAGWVEAATRAAMRLGEGAGAAKAAGMVSAAVALSDHVLRRMLVIKLIQMTALLTAVATAGILAWTAIGAGQGPKHPAARAIAAAQVQAPRAGVPQPKDDKDQSGKVSIRGRVIAPDGKPVRNASIYLGQSGDGWRIIPVARTDADGRFRFDVGPQAERSENDRIIGLGDWSLKKAELSAEAPGYGAALAKAWNADGGDVELRLVADDVPIRGRILDTQGRPIPGVNVRVGTIEEPPPGDLDALFTTGTIQEGRFSATFANAAWWTKEGTQWVKKTIQTGPDGRFQIDGAGRDRLVLLEFDGPGIESGKLWAMTRVAPPSAKPQPVPIHGASFDYVAGASKPIEGVVRLKGTDRPLAGVRVSAFVQQARQAHARAITDKDGRFRFDGLPKVASYQVHASPKPGQPYLPASTVVADTEGLKPIPVTLEMLKGVVVRVRLIDKATGKPVAVHAVQHVKLPSNRNEGQASVYATNPAPKEYLMTVPPGLGFFYAAAEGRDLPYTRARITPADRGRSEGISDFGDGGAHQIILSPCHTYRIVDVPANVETFNLDMELTRGASRKGRLSDPDGKPVSGGIARGLDANWQVNTLDDETFQINGLEPGKPRTVSFIHVDRRLAGAVLVEPGEGPLEVRLAPCGAAVGRLVDGDGQPLAGATIHIAPQDHRGELFPGAAGLLPAGDIFTADQDGRFRVEGINPVLSVRVAVNPRSQPNVLLMPEKSKVAILRHLTAKPGETVDLGEIRLSGQPNR